MSGEAGPPATGSAVVVGGGIGGLTAAIGLCRIGWTVTVLERAPALAEVGAGLSLWANAMRALDVLDVGAAVGDRGIPASSRGNMRTPTGRWLRRSGADDTKVLALHRADLHEALRSALPSGVLRVDATVTGIEDSGDAVTVTYAGAGGEHETRADVVVGADGIDSTVRGLLWPTGSGPTFRGRTVWRGVTAPGSFDQAYEGITLGRGEQFGILPLPDSRTYWFLTADTARPDERFADELAEVRRRVGDWHDPIPAVLAATPPEQVLHHDITDLAPLPTYVQGRVVLLGDAAHAMTPDLGQGACLAIEDAVVLASRLARNATDPVTAFQEYDRDHRPGPRNSAAGGGHDRAPAGAAHR